VHDLLGQHLLLEQLPDELDVAQRSPAGLRAARRREPGARLM